MDHQISVSNQEDSKGEEKLFVYCLLMDEDNKDEANKVFQGYSVVQS